MLSLTPTPTCVPTVLTLGGQRLPHLLNTAWKSVASFLHEALLSFQKHSYHEDGVFLQGPRGLQSKCYRPSLSGTTVSLVQALYSGRVSRESPTFPFSTHLQPGPQIHVTR